MNLIFRVILLLNVFVLSSCKENESKSFNALDFQIIDSIVVELPLNFPPHSLSMSFYSKSDTDFLQLQINKDGGFLVDIDISNQNFKQKINITKHLKSRYAHPVFFSHAIDSDSVLILQSPSNYNLFHDTILTVFNRKGKLLDAIGIDNPHFPSRYNDKKSSNIMFVYQDFSDIEIKNSNVFLRTNKLYNGNCDTKDFFKNSTLGGHINLDLKEQNFQVHTVFYPDTTLNDCDSLEWRIIAWNDSIVYYVFNYSDDVVKYNYQQNKSLHVLVKQSEFLSVFSRNNDLSIRSYEYNESFKFEREGLIFRTAYYPKPLNLELESYENQKFDRIWIGAYDSDFNLIAENTAPNKFHLSYPRPTEYKGELYALKRKKSEDNKVVIYKIKPKFFEMAHSEINTLLPEFDFSEQKPKIPLSKYLVSEKTPNNAYVLFVPEASCPSCANYVLDEYLSNFDEYTARKLYLWVSKRTYDHYLAKHLKDRDLEYRVSKFIFVSEDEDVENIAFPIDPSNPMVILLENQKVKSTFLFNPDQLRLFDNFEEVLK